MAILDQQTVLWDNVALTTSAYSTNAYDLGTAGATPVSANADLRDISLGEPLAMVIFVTVAATTSGTQTYEFDVVQAATSTLSSSPDTLVQVALTTTQAATLLAVGKVIVVPIPSGSITKRYIGGHYVSANSAAVSVTGAILPLKDVTQARYYATAIVIQ